MAWARVVEGLDVAEYGESRIHPGADARSPAGEQAGPARYPACRQSTPPADSVSRMRYLVLAYAERRPRRPPGISPLLMIILLPRIPQFRSRGSATTIRFTAARIVASFCPFFTSMTTACDEGRPAASLIAARISSSRSSWAACRGESLRSFGVGARSASSIFFTARCLYRGNPQSSYEPLSPATPLTNIANASYLLLRSLCLQPTNGLGRVPSCELLPESEWTPS